MRLILKEIKMIKITDTKIRIKGRKGSELAKLLGVTRQTIWNWTNGIVKPNAENMRKLRKLAR
jgi:transcriptional regulator with XRE-family HTH domain